jgi:hypothetical protein
MEAADLTTTERPAKYGPLVESFDSIADILTLMLDETERETLALGIVPATVVLKTHVATKMIRNSYSPEDSDHRRDAVGYLGLLDRYLDEKEGA